MRVLNSRGGKGIGSTDFSVFWDKTVVIFEEDSAAHERRKGEADDVLYASKVLSIPNLIRQVKSLLQDDIDDDDNPLQEMPPIPSEEMVRLQFVPNNTVAETAAKNFGRLPWSRPKVYDAIAH